MRTLRDIYVDLIHMESSKRQDLLSKLGAWGPWKMTEWQGRSTEGERENRTAQ